MGKITVGNFGFSGVDPAARPDTAGVGEAIARGGAALTGIGVEAGQRRSQAAAAQASNNLLDHQLVMQQQVERIRDGLATGNLNPDQARAEFDQQAAKVQPPPVEHLTPEAASAYSRGALRVQTESGYKIDSLVDLTHRQNFKDQFTSGLDKLGKLAGQASEQDIPGIIEQAKTYGPVGRAAGVPANDVDTALQNWTDQTWFNAATNRAIAATDSMGKLKALQHDLSAKDGFYVDKLDTNKRNAVLSQVTNRIDTLQNRLIHEADKREADAQRALYEMDRQTSTGVPPPPDQVANWAQRTSGTSLAGEFQAALKDQSEIQDVLRLPPDQQLSYVQDKQADIDKNGGTVRDITNLQRTSTAVTKNINTMQQSPLLFAAQRTGQDVQPLDWGALLQPDGQDVFAKQLAARSLTITTLQKQYGPTVQNKPLLPQEAAQLAGQVSKATPEQATQLFGALRNAAGDDRTYQAMMQQIAPDSPVKALAGRLASKQRDITLQRNWIANDVVASSPDVASTMLRGEALLNPGKTEKGEDGKPKVGLYLPNDNSLQADFQAAVGSAFAGRTAAAETAFQAVKAYYVGKAAQTGRLAASNQDIDSNLVKEAISATIGTVLDYNGRGQVVVPWGMDRAGFESTVQRAYNAGIESGQIPKMHESQLGILGLRNFGDGTYHVMAGDKYLKGKDNQPVVLSVLP